MKLSVYFLGMLCSLFFTMTLFGQEAGQNVPVGSRAHSAEAQLIRKKMPIPIEKQQSEEQVAATEDPEEQAIAVSAAKMHFAQSMYYTSHPGVYHNPVSIALYRDDYFIERLGLWTEDGSIWKIAPSDESVALNWYPTDLLIITPNHSWFSSYGFKFTNQNTGESILADLVLGPIYNGPYTHWIVAIDYYDNRIYLEDGSVWEMSSFDDSTVSLWVVNDTVVIGVNDGWLSSSNPNILINVNMLNYATGLATY